MDNNRREKHYYISFDDLEEIIKESDDIGVVKRIDIFFKYRYARIPVIEGTILDEILLKKCKETCRPYFIKIYDTNFKYTVEYNFKNEDYITKKMFREMAQEKELYIFEKDYEYFKDSPVLYRVYKVKGTDYYMVVVEKGAYVPECLFPYICNDMYYNVQDF